MALQQIVHTEPILKRKHFILQPENVRVAREEARKENDACLTVLLALYDEPTTPAHSDTTDEGIEMLEVAPSDLSAEEVVGGIELE